LVYVGFYGAFHLVLVLHGASYQVAFLIVAMTSTGANLAWELWKMWEMRRALTRHRLGERVGMPAVVFFVACFSYAFTVTAHSISRGADLVARGFERPAR
jgi:hypothetical protein